jgi:hypothetical protein
MKAVLVHVHVVLVQRAAKEAPVATDMLLKRMPALLLLPVTLQKSLLPRRER